LVRWLKTSICWKILLWGRNEKFSKKL